MKRICPHCGKEMEVFDEGCPSCGRPSKPGAMLSVAAVLHGYRSWFVLIGALTVGWIILSRLIK